MPLHRMGQQVLANKQVVRAHCALPRSSASENVLPPSASAGRWQVKQGRPNTVVQPPRHGSAPCTRQQGLPRHRLGLPNYGSKGRVWYRGAACKNHTRPASAATLLRQAKVHQWRKYR